jgi:hypothetical protein
VATRELLLELSENTHTPDRISLFRIQLEVTFSDLQRGRRYESQVGPALQELYDRLKGVKRQSVIPIVRHVRHEDVDLYKVRVSSEVITVVNIKVTVFWYITLCCLVRVFCLRD